MKFRKPGGTHKRRKHHNPARKHKRRAKHNPAPSSLRRYRRTRHNPSGIDYKGFGIEVATAGAGALAAVYINNFAAKWIPVKFRGVASIAVGAAVVMFAGRSRAARGAAIGAAGMGLLDIVRNNFAALVPLSAEDAGYLLGAAAEHDEGLSQLLGQSNAGLPDVMGADTGMVPMGEDFAYLGTDTGMVPMGAEGEGEFLFADEEY